MSTTATIVKDCLYERKNSEGEYLTLEPHTQFIEETRRIIFENRFPHHIAKGVFRYDIKANTLQYWPSYLRFIKTVERNNIGRSIKLKVLSGFVLSTALIPGHYRLDTRTLVSLFSGTFYSNGGPKVFESPVKEWYTGIANDMAKKRLSWERIFIFEALPSVINVVC